MIICMCVHSLTLLSYHTLADSCAHARILGIWGVEHVEICGPWTSPWTCMDLQVGDRRVFGTIRIKMNGTKFHSLSFDSNQMVVRIDSIRIDYNLRLRE